MYKFGYRATFKTVSGSGGGGGSSSIVFGSSGDIDNPVVGDVLFVDTVYVSQGTSMQDYTASTITYKRDGSPITLDPSATQYVVTSDDVGSILSVDVTIVEQSGVTQSTITGTCANVATGSGWCLGDIQTNFQALYDLRDDSYPKIQKHDVNVSADVYRVKSLLGNRVDLKAQQTGHFIFYDSVNEYCSGTNANMRMSFANKVPSFSGANCSLFFKFTVPLTSAAIVYLLRYIGTTNEFLLYDPTVSRFRLDLSGLRTLDILHPGDDCIMIARMSDTPFTTMGGTANRKTELWVRVDDGVTPVEYEYSNINNYFAGADFNNYGQGNATSKMWSADFPVKSFGISNELISDAVMGDMKTGLINI